MRSSTKKSVITSRILRMTSTLENVKFRPLDAVLECMRCSDVFVQMRHRRGSSICMYMQQKMKRDRRIE